MTFALAQFEHHFSEAILKKAYKLFSGAQVKALSSDRSHTFRCLVKKQEVFFRAEAGQLLQTFCTCKHNKACEHLAAALFYFQKDSLQLDQRNNKSKAPRVPLMRLPAYEKLMQPILFDNLLSIEKPSHRTNNALWEALNNQQGHAAYALYYRCFEHLLKPYLEHEILNAERVKNVYAQTKQWMALVEPLILKQPEFLYLHLALLGTLPVLLQKRFSTDEWPLLQLLNNSKEHADAAFKAGLTAESKKIWLQATYLSIKNNKVLLYQSYLFLVPRMACILNRVNDLEELVHILSVRRYKKRYMDAYHPLTAVLILVKMRLSELLKSQAPTAEEGEWLEHKMGVADYYFLKGQQKKGMAFLEKNLQHLQDIPAAEKSFFVAYVLEKARSLGYQSLERQLLKQKIVSEAILHLQDLDRYVSLLPAGETEQALHELCELLSIPNRYYMFDKLALVLAYTKNYTALAMVLKREHGRFAWAQETALNLNREESQAFIQVYLRHLSEALNEARFFNLQKNILDKALLVFKTLSETQRVDYLSKLSNSLGENSALNHYLVDLQIGLE